MGYATDNLSGGVVGLHMIVYQVVFYACVVAERHLALDNWLYQMAATGILSMLSSLIVVGGLRLTSSQYLAPSDILILYQAILSALFAPVIFISLHALLRFLQKVWPRKQNA
jgi:rod shape-determining protein MreD